MIYTIYKPNKNINGGLATFRVKKQKKGDDSESSWTSSLFIELLKQNTWNSEKHTGTFDKESRKFITLNVSEAGEFINTFKNKVPFSSFHTSSKGSTSFSLSPYNWKRKVNNNDFEVTCFGLSVKSNNVEYKIPITPGEAEVLSVLLEHFIKEHASLALKEEESNRKNQTQNKQTKTHDDVVASQDIPF
jgi:hypothetical protein